MNDSLGCSNSSRNSSSNNNNNNNRVDSGRVAREHPDSTNLVQFTIRGPAKQGKAATTATPPPPPGSIYRITGRCIVRPKQFASSSSLPFCVQVTFKYHQATDIVKNWSPEETADHLKAWLLPSGGDDNDDNDDDDNDTPHNDVARCAPERIHSYDDDDHNHRNRNHDDGTNHSPPMPMIHGATLETRYATWELILHPSTAVARLVQRQAPGNHRTNDATTLLVQPHDRIKHVPLAPRSSSTSTATTADFFQALGVTNAQGQPRPNMASKLRQCQKFVEIVDHLIAQVIVNDDDDGDGDGDDGDDDATIQTIQIVDMGCGRGYLTFSLHSFLHDKYESVDQSNNRYLNNNYKSNNNKSNNKSRVRILSQGIDVRPKLVQEMSDIAQSLGPTFTGLSFQQGTIEDYVQKTTGHASAEPNTSATTNHATLPVLIALHACDTATDDALWSGVAQGAPVLVVAPCCHQQVRPQLNRYAAAAAAAPTDHHPLADVWRHNIYRERLAETVTDSLRALLLEVAGYTVQVFEFVGGEHTAKNCMITAVKLPPRRRQKQQQQQHNQQRQQQREQRRREELIERVRTLASYHGIREHKLAKWMDIALTDDDEGPTNHRPKLSVRTMPPL